MEIDLELLSSFIDEAEDLLGKWESICLELTKKISHHRMDELFRIAHNLKGGSRSVGLLAYGEFVHQIEDGVTDIRDKKVPMTIDTINILLEAQKHLSHWTSELKNDPQYEFDHLEFINSYKNILKGAKFTEVKAQAQIHEENTDSNSAIDSEADLETDTPSLSTVTEIQVAKKNKKIKKQTTHTNETIRISTQRLDQLIQIIGELSIQQSIIWHSRSDFKDQSKKIFNSIQLCQKLTKDLYDKAFSLRMQGIASLFQRLERSARDLALTQGKTIDIIVSGGDVELDKTVIEKMIDPLTHIIRNAVDHGIEARDTRLLNNKNEKATISIDAVQDSFGVSIIISDDGKGLDEERIRRKAIEKNIIQESTVLNKDDVLRLILMPGFSTAEKITDVSGRGVGMDVVKSAVEELQGKITIQSEVNKGSKFIINLPTSVSIIDAMIVCIRDNKYAVPLSALEEVVDMSEFNTTQNENMMKLRDRVVPIQSLEEYLPSEKRSHLKNINKDESSSKKVALICNRNNEIVSFLIDKVIGQQQIVVRPLNENIEGVFGFFGGTIFGDGEPGLILDMPLIIDHYLKKVRPMEKSA